uniref:Calponin-homology (CH) domain-containing protein n=1 Tax=Periophthalmus magnuspinnatus TaxID=409849 RepID=A0A3B4AS66_9GOBI
MSLDKAELCDSLLIWLQTFQVPSCNSKYDLTSGVAIAHVLHRIDPSWFNETWLGRIKEENGANWRLKVSNLKKILKSMLEYYHDILGHQISDEHLPDVRLLEERNTVYMQRTCELEEELRRANAVRNQLDTYKRQAHELHTRHSAEAMKAEKWQFEYKNLHDKYDALLKEKERLLSERDTLRETNDELRCAQVQQRCLRSLGDTGGAGSLASEIMPTELKETVVRLQSENKMLCAQEETYRQKLVEVQAELEQSQRINNTLETQNRLNQQQITELRCQIEEMQKALHEQDSKNEDSSLLKKKLEEHLEKLHEAHSDLQKKREVIDDLEPKVDSSMAKKIDELQEILRKKDEDMKQMEERYKKYMEKARTVIKTLDPKKQPGGPDVQALKNQLSERERKIQHLEHDNEKSRARYDQEEKLIISAWYNMGMALHQSVAGDRLTSPHQNMSFLAQQRQYTNARRGLIRHQPR